MASLDFETRALTMISIRNGNFDEEMEKMPIYESEADMKKELEPIDPLEQVAQVLTNPYLFVGLKGQFYAPDIKNAYTSFEEKLARETQREEQPDKVTMRYQAYQALGILTRSYKLPAIVLEESVLNRASSMTQNRIRSLNPIERYYALLALRDSQQQGRR